MNYSYIDNSEESSNYGSSSFSFIPLSKEDINENKKRQKNIQNIVYKYKLENLNSDYMDMSFFYFDTINGFIWQVQNIGKEIPIFYKPNNN